MAEEKQQPPEMPPQSEPFPGSRTPGWNDPPTLEYNPLSTGAGTPRPRLNLNKRVPFPLQGTGGGSGVPPSGIVKPTAIVPPNLSSYASGGSGVGSAGSSSLNNAQPIAVVHPMPNMNAPPPIARAAATETVTRAAPVELPADALSITMRTLRDGLPAVPESTNVRRDEIERRLSIIEQLWQSRNLSSPVQEKLYQLAKAITDRSYNRAMEVYTSLVSNHSAECAAWSVALRHVVLTLQPPTSSGATESNHSSAVGDSSHSNSSNIAIVPAMFVPAMPRQPADTIATSHNIGGGSGSVQHI